ncbi:hypothetical protein PFISCL1PPCAC_2728, partial [Pristionchus fissidentatus]
FKSRFSFSSFYRAEQIAFAARKDEIIRIHLSRYPLVGCLEKLRHAKSTDHYDTITQAISTLEARKEKRDKFEFSFDGGKIVCELFTDVEGVKAVLDELFYDEDSGY